MLIMLIDANEDRDVATADVVRAYLLADMNEFTMVKIVGTAKDIMCQVNPDYKNYITKERFKNALYLRLTKALYGCMQFALLWYRIFKGYLEKLGFVLNPYDPRVANKVIDDKQCTICWNVDDTKILHVDSKVVD